MVATIGFQLSSITPYLSTPEGIHTSFRRIAEIGYRYVQLQGVSSEIPDDIIVSALRDGGLICVATQEDYPLGFGADPERAIRRALACGANYLTCALIPKEVDSVATLQDFARTLSDIADKVRDAGLIFAFHPISPDYRLMDGTMEFEQLMNALPDHVQLTFCVYAAHSAGVDPASIFERYGDRIDLVHFKDDATQPDGTRHLTPLGQGSHDWSGILQQCDAHNVKYVFAEQERWLKDAFECASDSYSYLTSLR
ncbi:MAG: sugar phosphate isomerase/epimerase [Thermomicrobiales bacterium]|nr:sugar phosphate isomerase/epimerase [Thermomicrobiales bacterium]MCO5224316.1 sugar phosphate isomerase/epimerase [Thermomicrobiales bacterium]MCO5229055.1 sugar phosphate isomerase/epimerase [Thermomicrobiales bacterium]